MDKFPFGKIAITKRKQSRHRQCCITSFNARFLKKFNMAHMEITEYHMVDGQKCSQSQNSLKDDRQTQGICGRTLQLKLIQFKEKTYRFTKFVQFLIYLLF